MIVKLNDKLSLHVFPISDETYSEVAVNLVDEDRGETFLALIGQSDADPEGCVHMYTYDEVDDDPVEHSFDPAKCVWWGPRL